MLELITGPNAAIIMAALLALSEALALIPAVKANSVFQLIVNGLGFLKNKVLPKPPQA